MALKFNISIFCLLLWAMPRLAAQCPLPLDISMDSTVNLLWEQYLESGDTFSMRSNKIAYERMKNAAKKTKIDSLFRLSRQYMLDQLGAKVYCKRVDMELWNAADVRKTSCEFTFRFFVEDIRRRRKIKHRNYSFYFTIDQETGQVIKSSFPTRLLNCKENPSLCQFKVTNERIALQIAKDSGFVDDEHVMSSSMSHRDWVWEIEKRVNDDCGTQKISIDMRTGEATLSEMYSWHGCTPLAAKVGTSPIVIEGTVIDNGSAYFPKSKGIWTSRLVEVNRVFKGEIEHEVIEIIVSGGQLGGISQDMSHGQIYLPTKGTSAIFFLLSPWESNVWLDGQMIDSLSPYPVYYEYGYDPLSLYPNSSDYYSFQKNVELNTYQAIEKAAGQPRKNIRLPAVPDSAFVDWAVKNPRQYPVREIGLEYQLLKKYGPKSPDTTEVHLAVRSPISHSYLTKSKVVIRYSPLAYGDSIVAKGNLRHYVRKRKPEYANFTYGVILPPESYVFELKDLSDSTFQIEISRPVGEGDYFQVTPFSRGNKVLPAMPVVDLKIPILNKEANIGLDFVEQKTTTTHFHFDFEQNKEVPYKYVWLNDPTDFYEDKRRK
ncbi:MAG: hypothetical protein IPN76_20335 [Saprospiraceae bacterium]|nr:hypothetical protein [Saprospiraceae bacterium]